MANLEVNKLVDGKIRYNGYVYEKAEYPIKTGDIVQCNEDDGYLTLGGFYEVTNVYCYGDFRIFDNENDDRKRDVNDEDFIPYRKVEDAGVCVGIGGPSPIPITIAQPVHLIITNIASIEFKPEEVL